MEKARRDETHSKRQDLPASSTGLGGRNKAKARTSAVFGLATSAFTRQNSRNAGCTTHDNESGRAGLSTSQLGGLRLFLAHVLRTRFGDQSRLGRPRGTGRRH